MFKDGPWIPVSMDLCWHPDKSIDEDSTMRDQYPLNKPILDFITKLTRTLMNHKSTRCLVIFWRIIIFLFLLWCLSNTICRLHSYTEIDREKEGQKSMKLEFDVLQPCVACAASGLLREAAKSEMIIWWLIQQGQRGEWLPDRRKYSEYDCYGKNKTSSQRPE